MSLSDHLEKLNYFNEVAKQGSMKRASEVLFITQPSLTKSMKTLEEALGYELFHRRPRGVILTEKGEILFEYCQGLFSSLRDVEQRLQNPDDPMAGSIRIGTYDSIAIYFWPKFLKYLSKKYPLLDVELTTGRSKDIQRKLESRELDLAYIVEPKANDKIEIEIMDEDSFYLYQSPKIKEEIDSLPLILMDDAVEVGELSAFGKRKKYKTSSLESAKELTQSGLGIGVLPERVAQPLVEAKKLKKIIFKGFPKKGISLHKIGAAYQLDRAGSPLLRQILEELDGFN